MYAVIETGSKQYRVEVGTELEVELLEAEPGQTVTLDRVLLVADGESATIGRPLVDGATVSAEVVRFDRADKVISFKYRPKARRRVKKGHRQELIVLRVSDIVFGGKSAAEAVKKAQAAAKTERQRLEEAAARQAAEDAALAARLSASAAKAAAPAPEPATAKPTKASAKTTAKPTKPTAKPTANTAAKTKVTPTKPVATPAKPAAKPTSAAAKPAAPKRARTKKDE